MQQDNSSFWTDIKTFEERLAKSPESFCFARLSEIYLKVGLIDDALHTARQGVAEHPGYISGQKALAMACQAKGLTSECLSALKCVTVAIPEDQLSQKLLGRLSSDIGDLDAARLAFRTVLEFVPDDVECQLELESLERPSGIAESFAPSVEYDDEDDEEIIEDLEILEELDVYEEDSPEFESEYQESVVESSAAAELQHDPLSTGTLAELYVSQGFIHKALEIYRTILADDPSNSAVSERVLELECMDSPTETPFFDDEEFCEDESEDVPVPPQVTESSVIPVSVVLPVRGIADNAISTLEGWLENIRRIRSCR